MNADYFRHPRRFPDNVVGPFYTTGHPRGSADDPDSPLGWCGDCLWCGAPEAEAPTLYAPFDETYTVTYFVRQPSTPEETQGAIASALVCCNGAVRYGGMNPEIIAQLWNNPRYCDYIATESGELKCTVGEDGRLLPFAQTIVDKLQAEADRQWKLKQGRWWQFWR